MFYIKGLKPLISSNTLALIQDKQQHKLVHVNATEMDQIFKNFAIPLKKLTIQVLFKEVFNPLSTNPTKWSNTLKQFVGKLPTNCLSVFDHFVILALKGLIPFQLKHLKKFHLFFTFPRINDKHNIIDCYTRMYN